MAWSLVRWQSTFADQSEYLASLPSPHDRGYVAEACRRADRSAGQAIRGLLAWVI